MKKLTLLLLLGLVYSCVSKYKKSNVLNYFDQIQALNQILIKNSHVFSDDNTNLLDSLSTFENANTIINELKSKIGLKEIVKYNINGQKNNLGFSYCFGEPRNDDQYSYLIYSKNPDQSDTFVSYEQFSDCAYKTEINENWYFSFIDRNCNN